MKTAIIHPYIAHYRQDFFEGLNAKLDLDIFCYQNEELHKGNFGESTIHVKHLKSFSIGPFLFYNPFQIINKKYDVIILMLTFLHITTWILLLTKPFHKKKIILWGHGISVKRYIKEEQNLNIVLKWMISLAHRIWFYTKAELDLWKKRYPGINAISLNNTISELDSILVQHAHQGKEQLKNKYGIKQHKIVIYSARFNEVGRRIDLLVKAIEMSDVDQIGFIIIGDGKLKPDFSSYKNVYDFGALYERGIKNELFEIADLYFQPGWVGLSIVEAMAYGKPIFTFKRTAELMQCVEYSYIQDGFNGMIFDTIKDLENTFNTIDDSKIKELGQNARAFVEKELNMKHMIDSAYASILSLK